ncbi:TolC family protein [Mucilaginibacter pocheonensis]|uniref:Outer membrane protein TolC n=1 Tax=Mucilaginibacter pocheonensis TaxID=398050 RepID=A0ABU1TEC8_9SPHI|nr:TolC family protein [Mucilaginibacter pocheonensis]MDR6943732.1 outer membrane protein TolC [Mucilaginibacter pocheonensis]
MKKIYIIILLWGPVSHVAAQQTPKDTSGITLTLQEIWDKVTVQSRSVQIKRIEQNSNLESIRDAKTERLPDVSADGEYARVSNMPVFDHGIFHTPSQFPVLHDYYKIGSSAYLNIYNGNKTNLKIAQSKAAYRIAEVKTNLTLSEIKLKATAYYLDMQRSLIFEALLQKDIHAEKKQLERIKSLQTNGAVLKSDVLRAELKLSKQSFALVQLQNDLLIANDKLNTLIGAPDGQHIHTAATQEPDSINLDSHINYLDYADHNAFKVKISEGETELSRLQLKDVKANLLPKVGLFANYAYSYPQIFLFPYSGNIYGFGMAGIRASYSISALYQNSHKEKIAKLDNDAKEVEDLKIRDELREDVNEAYLRFQESIKRLRVAETNVQQATENRRIVNNTYFNHTSLITDLLDADTQLLQTQFDLAAAKISAQFQYYQLLNITGKL